MLVTITVAELRLFDRYIFSKNKEERDSLMKKWIEVNDPLSPLETAKFRFNLALESYRLSYDV